TILLVEDDDQVRIVAQSILRKQGYHVLTARDAEEALSHSERYAGTIDLLLTDVVMPLVSGRELAEHLTSLRPGVKVLYMSGHTDNCIVRHGTIELNVAYVEKPLTPVRLAAKVRAVLDDDAISNPV
ncbi:MAG TPA: response regulator, partial [Polyangiaceae bacterium]|nr:response regulator [Polyangiaceae bacterium]